LVDGTWLRVEERHTSDGGSLMVYLDITKLKRRETELKAALLEAEAANHAKSQFLANMSHELRTPLNAIIGFSEMIRDEIMGPVGQPAYQGYAGDIHQSGLHLLEVVNGILDLAKAEAGALTLAHDEVDLGELLSQVFRMVTPQATQAGVDLLIETPPGAAIIRTDERKLRQALLNLAGNAVKFTPAGGRVTMTASITETVARIAVDDTGIGIAPSDIPTVMRPFGQVDNAMSRKYEGTGLGLPLALRLVEHLGGTLVITSEIGRGTNALVTLPIGDTAIELCDTRHDAGVACI
jgi:signal transduction histidine kinase